MLDRILEPEVMDTREEAVDYDSMDHSTVNRVFVDDLLRTVEENGLGPRVGDAANPMPVLDTGTGTAQIPIELCSRPCHVHMTAVDLAAEMLRVAEKNVAAAGMAGRIFLERIDAKELPYADGHFEAVISNSIVHHIPEPKTAIAEMVRVLQPGGLLFVRDLLRPPDQKTLDELVQTYAGDENAHQRQMFRDSLHAALTVEQVAAILSDLNLPMESVRQTTDRHWTVVAIV